MGRNLLIPGFFREAWGDNLFSVGQFCDSDLEVAFRRNTCFVRSLEGVDLLKGNRSTNLYTINLHEMASASPICLMARATSTKSWLWHQHQKMKQPEVIKTSPEAICPSSGHLRLLVSPSPHLTKLGSGNQEIRNGWSEAARTMLIFSRAPLFLWAEAIATACYTQNRSIIHRRFNKTPYELINGRKPDISFLHVFGALCYPKNDREDIEKLVKK
ncbi:integrase, catalytic region, zinc finger, CCHC-type containing protein [Tanacetum coccineum]